MSDDVEDVMINTQVYGIFNPVNFHSFQNTWKILFLQVCPSCNSRILPLTAACECLRCGCLAHRKCIQSLPTCSFFTFEKLNASSDAKLEGESPKKARSKGKAASAIDSIPAPDKTANDMHFDSIFELKLEEIIEKATSIPTILGYIPQIKSPFCIWRTLLRAIVMRQTTELSRISPFCSAMDPSSTIESKVRSCLSDLDGFSGQLFVCCFYVFLSLNDLNTKELAIAHGRECIDTIVDGLLCVCNEDGSQDPRFVRSIVIAVEKFTFHEQNGAFYEKIFQFVTRESNQILLNDTFHDSFQWPEKNWKEFDKYAVAIKMKHCPKEKLMILVVYLQLIAEITTANSSSVLSSANGDLTSRLYIASNPEDITSIEDEMKDSKLKGKEGVECEEGRVLRREDINADKLIELLGCIIQRQQRQSVCNWIAEYIFLSSDIVSTDSFDSMAAEGYALATLQQCMSIMMQT